MIEVYDERSAKVLINSNLIQYIEQERYGGMTYVVMDDGRQFKVFESYEDIKSKIDQKSKEL